MHRNLYQKSLQVTPSRNCQSPPPIQTRNINTLKLKLLKKIREDYQFKITRLNTTRWVARSEIASNEFESQDQNQDVLPDYNGDRIFPPKIKQNAGIYLIRHQIINNEEIKKNQNSIQENAMGAT